MSNFFRLPLALGRKKEGGICKNFVTGQLWQGFEVKIVLYKNEPVAEMPRALLFVWKERGFRMPKRSDRRDTAKAEYIARRSRGEKVNLRDLAGELGISYQTLRNWKAADKWEEALPPKKRGGQPGNRNSAGKRNAAGSHKGAPKGNKNAEKDGAYSAVFFDMLTAAEKNLVAQTPLGSREALEHEMKILKFREHKILAKIADYEAAPEGELYISGLLDMRGPQGSKDGAKQNIGMYQKDSPYRRIMALQEALYKVQGRIAKVADRDRKSVV